MFTEQELEEEFFSKDSNKKLNKPTTKHTILNQDILSCACCEKPLLHLIITQNREQERIITHQYQAICPCGNKSFIKKIKGYANFATIGDLKIKDINTNNNFTLIEVI